VEPAILECGDASERMPFEVVGRNALLGEHIDRHKPVSDALLLQG
jgi:hypothetical protein